MKIKTASYLLLNKKYLALAIPLLMAAQAQGLEFNMGQIKGSLDSQISVGSSWRVESQDQSLLTQADGSDLISNSDDSNRNYQDGDAFSQIFKGSHDLQFNYQNYGGFVRGKYWYDSALENNSVDYGHNATASSNGVGGAALDYDDPNSKLDDSNFNDLSKAKGATLLDAFIYGEFDMLGMPLDVRLGRQVVSWGESTFIRGGVNNINPVDISAFRRPGAEIKAALLPVNMAFANVGLTDSLSMETFYQLEFQETVIPGCGTYFSTNDYASEGCDSVAILNGLSTIARDENGVELWVVDGTVEAGARLFRDIEASGNGGAPSKLIVAGDKMFFTAYRTFTGQELWVTNGDSSDEGTYMVKDFTGDNMSSSFGDFHSFKDKLYAVVAGRIWVSDGTEVGTEELDLVRRSANAANFLTIGDHFFFTDTTVGFSASVWVSDGVTTTSLYDAPVDNRHVIRDLSVFNGKVHFVSTYELHEATATMTNKVDLGNSNITIDQNNSLTVLNNSLLFSASLSDETNSELYQYNDSGVSLIKDITGDNVSSYPQQLTYLNGEVFFSADDKISGREIWKTDGTENGTVLFKDIKSGSASSNPHFDIYESDF